MILPFWKFFSNREYFYFLIQQGWRYKLPLLIMKEKYLLLVILKRIMTIKRKHKKKRYYSTSFFIFSNFIPTSNEVNIIILYFSYKANFLCPKCIFFYKFIYFFLKFWWNNLICRNCIYIFIFIKSLHHFCEFKSFIKLCNFCFSIRNKIYFWF